jgi:lipoyl synthase
VLVLVVLRPLPRTPMSDTKPVEAKDVGRFVALARLVNTRMPLSLGCARPPGRVKVAIEEYALLAGVNRIAYPDSATVELAVAKGLQTAFIESCCTLLPAGQSSSVARS